VDAGSDAAAFDVGLVYATSVNLAAKSSIGGAAAGVAVGMEMDHSEVALEEHIAVEAQSSTSVGSAATVKVVGHTCDADHAQMVRLQKLENWIVEYGMRLGDMVGTFALP
jgi:hypothetical protein